MLDQYFENQFVRSRKEEDVLAVLVLVEIREQNLKSSLRIWRIETKCIRKGIRERKKWMVNYYGLVEKIRLCNLMIFIILKSKV